MDEDKMKWKDSFETRNAQSKKFGIVNSEVCFIITPTKMNINQQY